MTNPILPIDRELAALLVLDEGRTMQARPQDVVVLIDFAEVLLGTSEGRRQPRRRPDAE